MGKAPERRRFHRTLRTLPEDWIETLPAARGKTELFLAANLERTLRLQPRIVGVASTYQQQVAALCLAERIKEALP